MIPFKPPEDRPIVGPAGQPATGRRPRFGGPDRTVGPQARAAAPFPHYNLRQEATMAEPARWAGPKTRILGDVSASEDLLIEGQVEGKILLPAHRLVVAQTARVKAEVFARDITIAGEAVGTFTASERVELEASARVEGRIVSPRVALADGAVFNGRVEPHKTEAAVRVAEYRMAHGEAPSQPT